MSAPIQVTLTPYTIVWRYQGDVPDGVISNATLTLFLQTAWKDENGIVYKVDQLSPISGTPTDLGFADEFASIQTKLDALIASMNT